MAFLYTEFNRTKFSENILEVERKKYLLFK